jgi:Zn-dependent peptidase ImmA (M78 family)
VLQDCIVQEVTKLKKLCGSNDPFEISKAVGLNIRFADLGNLKGMYYYTKKNRYAIINSTLDQYKQKIVCAHELAHDRFHRSLAKNTALQEFVIYDMRSRPEFEANIFASELLISDDDILDLAQNGYDAEQIAQELCTDINLISLKMSSMIIRGHNLRSLDIHRSNFLKS